MEKILVTGGAGFIGSHTVDMLVNKGFDVVVADSFEKQVHGTKKPDYVNQKTKIVNTDIVDKDGWKKILSDVDAVVHLAALVGMGQSMYQPTRYLTTNTIGTAKMYEVLLENPEIRKHIQKIIVASSKSIYGEGAYKCEVHGTVYPKQRNAEQLARKNWEVHCPHCDSHVEPIGITEEKPPQNLAIYALSKYDTERIALMLGEALGITTVAFRYFNVYGPRQSLNNPYTGVAAIFLSRIKNGNSPLIYEDGNQKRDFIYVEDIVAANLAALERATHSDVYNVGTGVTTSILQIADTLIELTDSKVKPNVTENSRPGDNRHDFADITKIQKDLKFKPKWTFKSGMERLIEWSQTQSAVDKFDMAEQERNRYFKDARFGTDVSSDTRSFG